jgi:oligopeptide/dipeptide ABC transporter ATP-binding protein
MSMPCNDDHVGDALLRVTDVAKHFPLRRSLRNRRAGFVHAVDGVSFEIGVGQTLGLVGESGSGKSTLGRVVLRLIEPTSGRIEFAGTPVGHLPSARQVRLSRRNMQMVFQDPFSSLDPMTTVGASIAEPLRTYKTVPKQQRRARVEELLHLVGLDAAMANRYPQEFSGGQLQRVAIARALAVEPALVVLDEPVSALDVSTQADIINLLERLQRELGIAYLFIAHDLAVVHHVSHRIAVMYLGQIVEEGEASDLYHNPRHPYTHALLSAIPLPDPSAQRARERIILRGDLPSPVRPPTGCRFHTRCSHVMPVCTTTAPEPFLIDGGSVSCHLHTTGPKLEGRTLVGLDLPTRPATEIAGAT